MVFHLGETVTAFDGRARLTLKGGGTLDTDVVVVGVGVRPPFALAEQASLKMDRGVMVDWSARRQRSRHLCRGRHRALARSAFGRCHPRRALGRGRTPAGPDRGAQHARAPRNGSTPCRFSGASTMTCRSTMSQRSNGTRSPSTAPSRPKTASSASNPRDASSLSPRFTATSTVSKRGLRHGAGRLTVVEPRVAHSLELRPRAYRPRPVRRFFGGQNSPLR